MSTETKNKLVPRFRFPEFQNDGKWEVKRLGEIGDFFNGGTPDTKNEDYWNGDILWFTPSEIKKKYLKESNRKITELGLKNSSAKLLPKGSILITTRATIGDVGIALIECTTNQGFQSLVVKQNNSNEFWYYYIFNNKSELDKRASGSTFKEITKSKIISIPVLAPSLPEQQKIASCLSSLDELIEAESQKLELYELHKKGLMQNLFPNSLNCDSQGLNDGKDFSKVPKLRFPEFQNDGEWEEKRLGEIGELLGGLNGKNAEDFGEGYPFITYMQVFKKSIIDFKECNKVKINEGEHQNIVKKGDILFTASSETPDEVGFASVITEEPATPTYLNSFCFILRAEHNFPIIPEFSRYLFHSSTYRKSVIAIAQGITRYNISKNTFKGMSIPFPSLPEQQQIASCLSSLDDLINAQRQKIELLKQHKKGLLQGLFPNVNEINL